jgi:hypothetical protein
MHKDIKRFPLDGIINDDSDFVRLRAQFETLIVHNMRDDGYVPVLDIGPLWSTKYDMKKDCYSFELTVYGVYVGKKKAWHLEGMDGSGRYLPRSTANPKSQQF